MKVSYALTFLVLALTILIPSISQNAASGNRLPVHANKGALTMTGCDHPNDCTPWVFRDTHGYSGKDGNVSILTVTKNDPSDIEITRDFIDGPNGGTEIRYSGSQIGNSFGGVYVRTNEDGKQEQGHWNAEIDFSKLDSSQLASAKPPQSIRFCAVHGGHSHTLNWKSDHYAVTFDEWADSQGVRYDVESFKQGAYGSVRLVRTQKGASAVLMGSIVREGVVEGMGYWHSNDGKSWNGPFRFTYGDEFDAECRNQSDVVLNGSVPEPSKTDFNLPPVVIRGTPNNICAYWLVFQLCEK